MPHLVLPILYSFRRCPYAMRARLAIDVSRQTCELREVLLRRKPPQMLQASPKGTVPVLIDTDGTVIDESLDIMRWALERHDPQAWLAPEIGSLHESLSLIKACNDDFKRNLDRYKYPNRFADADAFGSRDAAARYVCELEARLERSSFLAGSRFSLVDAAIAPFIRQFANVDATWFASQAWRGVHRWLLEFTSSERFQRIMRPLDPWDQDGPGVVFPFDADDSAAP